MKKFPFTNSTKQSNHQGGFTLLEMIVSTTIFIFVMLIIIGALISLTDASRKARATRIVLDNLSSAIDSMSRNIRMGTYLHCGCETTPADYAVPKNCTTPIDSDGNGGDICLAFEAPTGNPADTQDQVVYQLSSGSIERSLESGIAGTFVKLTAPEIVVDAMKFFVYGTQTNLDQPMVTMLIRGNAKLSEKIKSDFNVQTTIAVRTPNFTIIP